MRRVQILQMLRDRLEPFPRTTEWADEIEGGNASSERIRALCGDQA